GVQVFEGASATVPLFDSTSLSNPVSAASRYALAIFSIQQSVDLNIPGFQQYAQALATLASVSLSDNAFLDVAAADRLAASAPKIADRTAYWRSSEVVRYCQSTSACVSSAYTLSGCCRDNLEDWKNNTVVQDFTQQSCTFCNNTFNPSCEENSPRHLAQYLACTDVPTANVFQCDQRCVPVDTIRAVSPLMAQAVDAAGLTGPGVTLLNYGEALGGRTCEVRFSSLVPFIEKTPNFFAYYDPALSKTSLNGDDLSRCTASPNCPLVVENVSGFAGFPGQLQPDCGLDANGDGLWQSGETLSNTTVSTESVQRPNGGISSRKRYSCSAGQVIAVNESKFFLPAVQNGVLTSRTIATAADIARCRDGLCPLLLNPPTSVSANTPFCFTGPATGGFVDVRTAPRNNFVAAVPDNFGGFQCPSGVLAVANFCFSSCQNACAAPSCDPSPLCSREGVRHVPSGDARTVFNGWLNQSPVSAVTVDARFLSRGVHLLPAGLFSDAFRDSADQNQNQAGGAPVFSASYVVNSKNAPGGLGQVSNLVYLEGCGPSSDYPYGNTRLPDEGLYVVRDYNQVDGSDQTWLAEANAVELKPGDYLGSRSDVCRKPSWNTRVCETTFVDQSSPYGSCFNSILQYSGGPKRPGVDLALVGGLGAGLKQDVGFGVAPDGQVFALTDAGQHYAGICGGAARGIDPT
ncbi:MAG: hypothetical protein Q8P02_04635, partial [Candidatus Micrarchaeota archaeon]|nr:hypothetical protein [Candidatus Micrarchaeota archaeon]